MLAAAGNAAANESGLLLSAIATDDGTSTAGAPLLSGVPGLLVEGKAEAARFEITHPCTGGTSCTGTHDKGFCRMGCRAGFSLQGEATSRCWQGSFLTQEPTCVVQPPAAASNATRSVSEGATRGTEVGAPVTATVESPLIEIQYSLQDSIDGLFDVGGCTGQIVVLKSNVIDYEGQQSYVLKVDAVPNGFTASKTTITVQVNVVDVNDPPEFQGDDGIGSAALRQLPENATVGAPVGAPLNVSDPEGEQLSFRMLVGSGASGPFGINNVTGQIIVEEADPALLNFESESTRTQELLVAVSDARSPEVSVSRVVRVELLDSPDPPRFTDGVTSEGKVRRLITADTAVTGAVIGEQIAAVDEDVERMRLLDPNGTVPSAEEIRYEIRPASGSSSAPTEIRLNSTTVALLQMAEDVSGDYGGVTPTDVDGIAVFDTFAFTLVAIDRGGLESSVEVEVLITRDATQQASDPVITGVAVLDSASDTAVNKD